jgi:hypothetical protein
VRIEGDICTDIGPPTSGQLIAFAAFLRAMKHRMRRDAVSGSGYRLKGDQHAPESLKEAVLFVWQWEPLHEDMTLGLVGRRGVDVAAAVCESLAYDNTDGPA